MAHLKKYLKFILWIQFSTIFKISKNSFKFKNFNRLFLFAIGAAIEPRTASIVKVGQIVMAKLLGATR